MLWLFLLCVWLTRIVMGAAAAAAVWRIWPERQIRFIRYTAIHLHAVIIDALFAASLIFMAPDTQVLSRRLNIIWGTAILLQEIVRLPLLLYVLRPSEQNILKKD